MSFWKNWDKEERTSALRILGMITAALTIFLLMASVSYLFHWKEDMSLIAGPVEATDEIGNSAGTMGIRTGHLLISELFGLIKSLFLF